MKRLMAWVVTMLLFVGMVPMDTFAESQPPDGNAAVEQGQETKPSQDEGIAAEKEIDTPLQEKETPLEDENEQTEDAAFTDKPGDAVRGDLDVWLLLPESVVEMGAGAAEMKAVLALNGQAGGSVTLTEARSVETFSLEGNDYQVEIVPCILDVTGAGISDVTEVGMAPEDSESDSIALYKLKFIGLPAGADNKYSVGLTGKTVLPYETKAPVVMEDYAKQINIRLESMESLASDLNQDGKLDQDDLLAMKDSLNTAEYNEAADINKDGVIDIEDLSLVYKAVNTGKGTGIFAGKYDAFDTNLIQYRGITAEENSGVSDAAIQALLNPAVQENVQLASKDGGAVTKDNPIVLPLVFEEAVEMTSIKLTAPSGNSMPTAGFADVTLDDGTITIPFKSAVPSGVQALMRSGGENVITIDLGKKVAVKKVVFNITATTDPTADLAEIAKVEFLKDIVPENPSATAGVVKGFKAVTGDKSVTLSWNAVPNMTDFEIRYGEKSGSYTEKLAADGTSIKISGLTNLNNYYFVIQAKNGSFSGPLSAELTAVPQPPAAPSAPKGMAITPGDAKLSISWGTSKNASYYIVYYKEEGASAYKETARLTDANTVLEGLTNGVKYRVYAVSGNDMGVSGPSEEQTAVPQRIIVNEPKGLPTLNRIDNSHITNIVLRDKGNVNTTFYPAASGGYNPRNVIDGDYTTHYTEANWSRSPNHIVTFDTAYDMNYVAYVTRLDQDGIGNCRDRMKRYNITVWTEGMDLKGPGKILNIDEETNQKGPNNYISVKDEAEGLAILTFPRTENVIQIEVGIDRQNYQPATASEILFYEYYPVDDYIRELFANDSYTKLADGVKEERITELRNIVNGLTGGYFVDKNILLNELNLAEGLLKNDPSKMGSIVDVRNDMPTANMSSRGFSYTMNNFQPLGITAKAGDKVALYVDCPEDSKLSLVATQYNANWNNWMQTIPLTKGRNIVTIPKIGSDDTARGGSLYITYGGSSDGVTIQVTGAKKIPFLDVTDLDLDSKDAAVIAEIKDRINKYVTDVAAHAVKSGENNIENSTEIAMRDVLLSIPAEAAVKKNADQIYSSLLAWQKEINTDYAVHGLSKDAAETQNSWPAARLNMRYTRLFDGAFMYASGGHIGMGYGSAKGLLGSSFGWGISHEIGHIIDQRGLVRSETTNNIYSLYTQVDNGKDYTGTSRLENSNKYQAIYEKTSKGDAGFPNDVFVGLGMYWQLHLAYDEGGKDSVSFFPRMYQKIRDTNYRADLPKDLSSNELLVAAASDTAEKDLTEFFSRWGIPVSDAVKTYVSKHPEETKAIYYLNDDARRYRLGGGSGMASADISADAAVSEDRNSVTLTIHHDAAAEDMIGYEIYKNGKVIGFTTTKTYKDIMGAANNISLGYEVVGYDKLLNATSKVKTNPSEVKVNSDKAVDKAGWTYAPSEDGAGVNINLGSEKQIAGIRFKGAKPSGDCKVYVKKTAAGNWVLAKTLDFTKNDNLSDDSFISYFNKPGAENGDTRIWTFDAVSVKIEGSFITEDYIKNNVDLLSYPGDNITIGTIGRLKSDYSYTNAGNETETIAAGTLVVTGTYRGDPVYNIVALKGMFAKKGQLDPAGKDEEAENFVNGYGILFAEIPKDGSVSETSDGFWIYVPEAGQQDPAVKAPDVKGSEDSIEGSPAENGHKVSELPNRIRAVLYRSTNANPEDLAGSIEVSNTVWMTSPGESDMPEIDIIGGGK